jgi:hypothetical protein
MVVFLLPGSKSIEQKLHIKHTNAPQGRAPHAGVAARDDGRLCGPWTGMNALTGLAKSTAAKYKY